MIAPTLADLMLRPARMLCYPDYGILDDPLGDPSGHAQIFWAENADRDTALRHLHEMADKAIAHGIGKVSENGSLCWRYMNGVEALTERHGFIPAYRWRLAILQPLTVLYDHLSDRWGYRMEFGLDVDHRKASPATP